MERRTIFAGWKLPVLFVIPQLILTFYFFFWPAAQAILSSVERQDAFGISTQFVGLENFYDLFTDPLYLEAAGRSVLFILAVTAVAMLVALVLSLYADREIRGRDIYRTLLIWPYAVAPAIAGVLWVLLMNPHIGMIGTLLNQLGMDWDYKLNGTQAMILVIVASAWQRVSYNFIFFLAGLQSIPKTVIEAARMDGAGEMYRLRTIILPLLTPTMVFLVVVNVVYAAFDTFAIIAAMTQGGPGRSTETLVFKVYRDGIINLNIGASSAQSVILMAGVIVFTMVQFRLIGKRS
jgi:sn-glycerol 3-phosphate transport system permease protein